MAPASPLCPPTLLLPAGPQSLCQKKKRKKELSKAVFLSGVCLSISSKVKVIVLQAKEHIVYATIYVTTMSLEIKTIFSPFCCSSFLHGPSESPKSIWICLRVRLHLALPSQGTLRSHLHWLLQASKGYRFSPFFSDKLKFTDLVEPWAKKAQEHLTILDCWSK